MHAANRRTVACTLRADALDGRGNAQPEDTISMNSPILRPPGLPPILTCYIKILKKAHGISVELLVVWTRRPPSQVANADQCML
jgi:hypothetical protein